MRHIPYNDTFYPSAARHGGSAGWVRLRDRLHAAVAGRRQARRLDHGADAEEIEWRGQELEESHALLDAALNNMAHGVLIIDSELRVVMCNREMLTLFRFDPDIVRPGATLLQVLCHSVALGNHPGVTANELMAAAQAQTAAGVRVAFRQTLPGGRLLSVRWGPMERGGWVCSYEDITERESASARADHLARHDAVTGLPNRRALTEALLSAWAQRRGGGFQLLCLAIDRFREICDTSGHHTGELLVQQVAIRLSCGVRSSDMVADLGGGCFAILQAAPAPDDAAMQLALRLIDNLRAPSQIGGKQVMASVSVGIAGAAAGRHELPAKEGAEELLRNATLALTLAIQEGGGMARFYAPDMDRTVQARHTLEMDLRHALEAGQLELHYQPLVSAAERRVTGFEALLRWRHPQRGMVSPAEFIPLAEELGLIRDIGAWVLRTACCEAATWPASVRVAVNLSPLQFVHHAGQSLPEIVAEALALSGLPGHRLELEITESVRLQEDAATLDTLHQLRSFGARIALDDFGTGYSSLSYLRCFPFDKLKIDQSFVRGLPAPEAAAIVRAVAALGASLGITTVAEGVETPMQLAALVAEHCDEMQGYLFSPPRPAADVPALLNAAVAKLAA
jgi:diguanylate cyclase (GGDEF)-like protein